MDLTRFPAVIAPDGATAAAARARQNTLTKPPGSLGRLEELSVWVASCQGACPPRQFCRARIVVFAGGTGNPFFTTDTTAVLRAAEMECDAVLKATDVDGVYSADPKKDRKAVRYDQISLREAFDRDLKVLDATAFALARENSMPIIVFSIRVPGAIEAVLRGTGRATVVSG